MLAYYVIVHLLLFQLYQRAGVPVCWGYFKVVFSFESVWKHKMINTDLSSLCVYSDPDPVRKLKSDVTENSVLLTWDANLRTNEDKVCITYRAESDMWSPRSIASCNEKKFSKENLRPGFRYEFRVWVLNGARKSISRYITVDLGEWITFILYNIQ